LRDDTTITQPGDSAVCDPKPAFFKTQLSDLGSLSCKTKTNSIQDKKE